MKKISLFLLTLPLSTIATLASLTIAVAQQVTPDGTVSTTVITPDGKNFNINDGTTRGGNLFHSFKEFSVPTGGSANFNNAANIQNIISRVTGGSVSSIDGLIKTLNPANLFLLNPAGIIFGPNASLNIGGSFLGSTANSFLFDNGFEFSATDPQAPPLLTISIPIGLRYRDNPQNITTQSTTTQYPTLEVAPGKTLALVGGNVSLDGPDLLAPGGRIELGGLSAPGTVGLNSDGSLSFPEGVQRGDVSLTNEAFVDVRAGGGGSIAVHARNLELSGESFLRAGIKSGLGTLSAQAGDIKVDAKETVSLDGSKITNHVEETALGNAGGIELTTKNLSLTNGAQISASTFGQGNAGSIIVNATGTISAASDVENGFKSGIFSTVESSGVGDAGGIQIKTNNLFLTDGAQINANTLGKGNSGRIIINATGTISADGENKNGNNAGISSQVDRPQAEGDAGGIEINTNNLFLTNGAVIAASTFGTGNAGSVIINATGTVKADGEDKAGYHSGVYSNVESSGVGDSGGIKVNTNNLSLTNGGIINAGTYGKGDAGSVIINATDTITADGEGTDGFNSGIYSRVSEQEAEGDAGGIEIKTNNLYLTNGGNINASTLGKGSAGSVIINAAGTISADGEDKAGTNSGIFSSVSSSGVGDSGGIRVNTNNLSLTNGGTISASTFGNGNAGSVIIDATGTIKADGEDKDGYHSGIFSTVSSSGVGDSSGIKINTNNLSLTKGGIINAGTYGKGDAGSVIINATDTITADGEGTDGFNSGIYSRVSEQEAEGDAGGIEIKTNNLYLTNGGRINASTLGKGSAGSVIINATGTIKADGEDKDGSYSGIFSNVNSSGVGDSGGIKVNTNNLSLTNGGTISAITFGKGNAGNIIINATGTISADGEDKAGTNSGIFSNVESSYEGNAGGIEINTNNLSLTNGAEISASTFGKGNAGSIIINATGTIKADGEDKAGFKSGIYSTVSSSGVGDSGGIKVNTNNLSLTNGGTINAGTFGKGDAGSVIIDATGTISADGEGKDGYHSGIFSSVSSSGVGKAGGIEINTNNLSLTNGGLISAGTSGTGNAGIIIINATDTIKADGEATDKFNSGIYSRVSRQQAQGDAGGIRIKTDNLSLSNGAQVNTSSLGKGSAGSVIINATGTISIDGKDNNGDNSGVFSTVESSGVGNAGGIDITARSLSLTNGGTLSSTNFSNGSAGNITVTTTKDIRLDNKAFIEANTRKGQGNISLKARDLILRRNSNITTNATGTATGGNITIDTGNLVALENSNITAKAQQGYGGNIIITTTGGRFLSPDSVISAASEAGPQFNGTVQFNTPPNDPSKGLFELTETVIDPAQQIAQHVCIKGFGSSFTITGRGGLPTDPKNIISTDNVRVDLVKPAPSTVNSTSTTQKQPSQEPTVKKIIPARGWIFNEKGEVLLVGYDPTKTGVQRPQPAPTSSCAAVK